MRGAKPSISNEFCDRAFWLGFHRDWNLAEPHFRLERCALLADELARGPALHQAPSPNLRELAVTAGSEPSRHGAG